MTITQAYLKQRLHYDPETGVFTWLFYSDHPQKWNKKHAGKKAGALMTIGYILIRINKTPYLAHRLAFLYMTGQFPPHEVDHIDHDRQNNRWSNLRLATKTQNCWNRKAQSNNKTGFKGVSFSSEMGQYIATISVNGQQKRLGFYADPAEAHAVYSRAAKEYFGEFARS